MACTARDQLAAWAERNVHCGPQLCGALEQHGIVAELTVSNRVAQWAYAQTEAAQGLTWLRADEMVPLGAEWRGVMSL